MILVAGFLMITIISATVFSMPIIKEAAEEVCAKSLQDTPSHTISQESKEKESIIFFVGLASNHPPTSPAAYSTAIVVD